MIQDWEVFRKIKAERRRRKLAKAVLGDINYLTPVMFSYYDTQDKHNRRCKVCAIGAVIYEKYGSNHKERREGSTESRGYLREAGFSSEQIDIIECLYEGWTHKIHGREKLLEKISGSDKQRFIQVWSMIANDPKGLIR